MTEPSVLPDEKRNSVMIQQMDEIMAELAHHRLELREIKTLLTNLEGVFDKISNLDITSMLGELDGPMGRMLGRMLGGK